MYNHGGLHPLHGVDITRMKFALFIINVGVSMLNIVNIFFVGNHRLKTFLIDIILFTN